MIKYDNNTLKIEGHRIDLIAELMCIMRFFVDKGVLNKEKLLTYALASCYSADELKDAVVNAIDNMDNIGDALTLLHVLEKGV